jgi:predicted ATP-dependent endonuclease of OLD family
MAEEIKICKLILKDFEQFKDIDLDFTNPKTGEPLEKICFIGRNGTGKSKLLKIIEAFVVYNNNNIGIRGTFIAKLKVGEEYFYNVRSAAHEGSYLTGNIWYKSQIEEIPNWYLDVFSLKKKGETNRYEINNDMLGVLESILRSSGHLVINCPPEDEHNLLVSLGNVPETTLAKALQSHNTLNFRHQVSPVMVNSFWEQLMWLIERRRHDREKFEEREDNQNKTKKELVKEFDKDNPKILENLGQIWNKILSKAGLEFDVQNAKLPDRLDQNLQAYINLIKGKKNIAYNALSTGIRNFIFKIGHIYSLYFDREVISGVLLLDEPENSLFPDFLYDLIDIYKQVTTDKRGINNTQIFVATHNPIIAAQFKPEERIILEFDDDGEVTARHGNTPEGDDPNDVLKKDFAIRSLLGKKGIEKWERFLELKNKLRKNGSNEEANEWRNELMKIGEEYNFPVS